MTIAHVTGPSHGGIRAHVLMVATAQREAGRRVTVSELGGPGWRDWVAGAIRLWGIAKGAQVIHAHGLRAGAAAVLAVRLSAPWRRRGIMGAGKAGGRGINLTGGGPRHRPRVVVTLHTYPPGGTLWPRFLSSVLGRVTARADLVLGVSSEIVDWIARLGARHPARALVPPPPGRPSRPEKEVRQELGVPDDHFLIVTVARLAGQKGLPLLVATAARLKDRPLTWVIAGEGPLRAQLEAIIKKRDLPVRPLGRRPDVPDLLGAADAVVSTSLTEGQPVALQQALAAGCAVVATDVGGTRETLADGATLVAPEAGALADGIGHLLDDPAARDALRRRAAARAAALPTLQDLETQLRWAYGAQRSPNG